ncbi:unnamed protein product, partial [Rotaria magnacalcarata]
LRQQIVSELIAHPKLYGLDLNKSGKFELKIMSQEGINLIPQAIMAFSNLYNCKVIVFEKRRYPINFGEDNLPNLCYLNSYNSLHYNLLIKDNVKIIVNNIEEKALNINNISQNLNLISPSPLILSEGRVESEVNLKNNETVNLCNKNLNKSEINFKNNCNILANMENTACIKKFENNKKILASMESDTLEILVISSPKLIFNKWSKQEISIMQRANAQLKLLKSFITNYPPSDARVIRCKHTPNLELFLPNINAIQIVENILVCEVDIGLDTHRYLAIVPLDKYIQGAIDIHLSHSHCGQHVLQNLLRETVWNPHDWRVIKDVCHTCQMCQRFKAPCNVAHPGYKKIISTCMPIRPLVDRPGKFATYTR